MRILFAMPVVPWPTTSGLKVRSFYLARELALRHEVHLLCLANTPIKPGQRQVIEAAGLRLTLVDKPRKSFIAKAAAYLRSLVNGTPTYFILSWEAEIFDAIGKLEKDISADVAVAEHLFMARYITELSCPKVLVEHNVESNLHLMMAGSLGIPQRWIKKAASAWFANYERRMLGRMQWIVSVSQDDAKTLDDMSTGVEISVVENGVSCEEYKELYESPPQAAGALLYIGSMGYVPNVDAVKWFSTDILPGILEKSPETVVFVAGSETPSELYGLDDGVNRRILGFVEDIKPLYGDASIFVVPLRMGGGSRLKILEAFAAGRPVVSTSIGAAGIDVTHGEHLLLADTPEDFSRAVLKLQEDGDLYEKLRDNARRLVEEKYDWPVLARKFEAAIERAAKQK
ncbi:MAG: glycosyltransferase family 4 protein [Thermoleophilia bacterium]|jgi:glycosyltransferase involved in cell wall biosynthesis